MAGTCLECGPGTCAGCCAAGQCEPGTTDPACGAGGLACSACPSISTCIQSACAPGEIVLFGGAGSMNDALGDTWTFDGSSWTQRAIDTGPPDRAGHAMASLIGTVMLFGGVGSTNDTLGDTWTFDGASWTQSAATGPAPRALLASATYGGEGLVFGGGDDGTLLDDTWLFDGTSWSRPPLATAPTPRSGAAMAGLSTTRGESVVLFGGATSTGTAGDTWLFGTGWAPLAPGPSARAGAAMASLGANVVLFGGYDLTSMTLLDDTWSFDGQSWTQASGTGPSPRSGHAMATLRGLVVLFGGTDGTQPLDDTWTFDGNVWTQVLTAAGPPARSAHAMATLP